MEYGNMDGIDVLVQKGICYFCPKYPRQNDT